MNRASSCGCSCDLRFPTGTCGYRHWTAARSRRLSVYGDSRTGRLASGGSGARDRAARNDGRGRRHSRGQYKDIVVWNRDQERWPLLFITWRSGLLRTDNEPRPFERDYPAAFIASRAGLERAVRQRFSGSPLGVSAPRIAAARLLVHMTEPTDALELVPSQDPEFNQVWALREPSLDAREHAVVDMASGRVRPPDPHTCQEAASTRPTPAEKWLRMRGSV